MKTQRGQSSLLVLMLVPITSILVYSLVDMAIIARKQVVINKNIVGYAALLDASIDYTIYAIKNRWCMDNQWNQVLTNCTITSPRNLERMTLDLQAVNALRELDFSTTNGYSSNQIALTTLQGIVNIATIPSTSPLFQVAKNLADSGGTGALGVQQITITVNRYDNTFTPVRGRETHLEIIATLQSGSVIFRNLSAISARSRIVIQPRELNYFSLLVPNDLYLDRAGGGAPGDFYIPVGGGGGTGVLFQSPVYVNGNIHIPSSGGRPGTSATFSQRVVLGGNSANGTGGQLLTNNGPAAPDTPGGFTAATNDQVYSLMNNFNGFKKGIDIDGSRDYGLDVFAGLQVPPPIDTSGYTVCKGIDAVRSDLTLTAYSEILLKQLTTGVTNSLSYMMSLNLNNYFYNQEIRPYFVPDPNNSSRPTKTRASLSTTSGSSVILVTANAHSSSTTALSSINDSINAFTMNRNMTATLYFKDLALPKTSRVPTYITIQTTPLYSGSEIMPEFIQITVTAVGNLSYIPDNLDLDITGFDIGNWDGMDRRNQANQTAWTGYVRQANLHFAISSGAFGPKVGTTTANIPTTTYVKGSDSTVGLAATYPIGGLTNPPTNAPPAPPATAPIMPDPSTSTLEANLKLCQVDEARASVTSDPFKAVSWSTSFTNGTRFSWHFKPLLFPAGNPNSYTQIPETSPTLNISDSTSASGFQIYSIVGKCVIPSTTTFVAGFFVCDQLTIASRNQPLVIEGTIIAGQGSISPAAISSGVTFRSIYHPQTTIDLQTRGILTPYNGVGTCSNTNVPAFPVWWPGLNLQNYNTLRNCNVISLRDKANPFTWTTVDPDCGVNNTSPYVQCKRRAIHFLVREISRESDLQ